jgi:hypothetical protein
MPSRQERRKAERDADKARAKAGTAGAAGAAGDAAADANLGLNVNPVGHWNTQAENPTNLVQALGAEVVQQKAEAVAPGGYCSPRHKHI